LENKQHLPPEIIFFGCFPDHDDSDGNYLDSDCMPLWLLLVQGATAAG